VPSKKIKEGALDYFFAPTEAAEAHVVIEFI
jgi:hypothetical protein